MLIYISGPIAGHEDAKERFEQTENALRGIGYDVVNPFSVRRICLDYTIKNCASPSGAHPWECYLKADIRELVRCDGVCTLGNAMESPGGRLEIYIAVALKIPVHDLNGWRIRTIARGLSQ